MNRKKYVGKIRNLVLAISKSDGYNGKCGESIRYAVTHVKMAVETHGSYEACWNNDAIKSARRIFLHEDC